MKVIELVTFSLRPDTTDREFLEAVEESNKFLRLQPGFLSRHISKHQDGVSWMDLVFWQTMNQALTAAAKFNASEYTSAFNALLLEDTVNVSHFEIQLAESAA